MRSSRFLAAFLTATLGFSLLAGAFPIGGPMAQVGPTTRPAKEIGQPLSPQRMLEQRRRLMDLTRQSMEQLEAKNYPEAERTLRAALRIDPKEPTNLYNMACLQSLTHHPDLAMEYLEKSATAGFSDFIHIRQDTDLNNLHQLPRWKAFLANEGQYQRIAAQQAVVALKKQFGADYIYEIDDADKLIFATNTDKATLDALRNMLQAQARSQRAQIFDNMSDQYITVVVPSAKDYHKIVHTPGILGFYNPQAHTLIADGLGFVTTHEFTHAMHFADIESLGQEHPIWMVEGMAVLFERAQWEMVQGVRTLVPKDGFRLDGLQKAARLGRLIPFHTLVNLSHQQFMAQAGVGYAEGGSIMQYLYDHKLLKPFYEAVKADYSKDHTARMALEQVTHMKLDDFEKVWKSWMMSRKPPTMFTGTNGPFLGVMFGQANDGIRVDRVLDQSPASRAGLKVGDEIIGLDGEDVRDVMTFMPMIAAHKVGESVKLKVRRGKLYSDMILKLAKRADVPSALLPMGLGFPTTRPSHPAQNATPTTRPTKPMIAPAPKPAPQAKPAPVKQGVVPAGK